MRFEPANLGPGRPSGRNTAARPLVSKGVIDALVLDAAGVAGLLALGVALRGRRAASSRPAPVRLAPIKRSIRLVRRRHRRAARAIVELARECVERHAEGSFEAFTARETLRVYLPETLAAYLAVPPAMRRVRTAERPSADDELSRQLKTLYAGLERIREADAETGAQQMAANAAFLNERFGSATAGGSPERRSVLAELVEVVEAALRRY